MRYYVMIELPEDNKHAFGAMVPDLPGCFSAGDTLEEALVNVQEAILLQVEDLLERGKPIPTPSTADLVIAEKQPGNWVCMGIDIPEGYMQMEKQRVNISMPLGILNMIDDEARRRHQNRSSFLTDAALEAIKKQA